MAVTEASGLPADPEGRGQSHSRLMKAEEAEEAAEEGGERDRPPEAEAESEGWDILVADCIDPGGMLRQGVPLNR